MTLFRPCIDLHGGVVKQIVGGSLRDDGAGLKTNFVAEKPAGWFAARYRDDGLTGGHVIQLGPGNDAASRQALAAWPDGLHLGGGVNADNAKGWIAAGAQKVIVTSWLYPNDRFAPERVAALVQAVGRERLVIDLSCRRVGAGWNVATNRWQTITDDVLSEARLHDLAGSCSEFLIHAADVEGLCNGIDEDLVAALGRWSPIPVTYAGGCRSIEDFARVESISGGRVDLTVGSALDLFGGNLVKYDDCVAWNAATSGRPVVRSSGRPESANL